MLKLCVCVCDKLIACYDCRMRCCLLLFIAAARTTLRTDGSYYYCYYFPIRLAIKHIIAAPTHSDVRCCEDKRRKKLNTKVSISRLCDTCQRVERVRFPFLFCFFLCCCFCCLFVMFWYLCDALPAKNDSISVTKFLLKVFDEINRYRIC